MTDQHPLTDEIIAEIASSGYIDDYGRYNYAADDLRTATDWQLEQDAEFWKLVLVRHLGFTPEAATTSVENFKKAMRPTREDN